MQPQPFGLYTLIHRINVGGMAEVFKACYYDNGQPAFAAIKRILPHLAQDRSFIDMFITEAHTAGRLDHQNIAQIIEQGEEDGEYYISMEYVSGRDLLYLRHHLRERGMFFPPALAAFAGPTLIFQTFAKDKSKKYLPHPAVSKSAPKSTKRNMKSTETPIGIPKIAS